MVFLFRPRPPISCFNSVDLLLGLVGVILTLHARILLCSPCTIMDLLDVSADVARLGEPRAANVAFEGASARVLAEVVSQVARLGKDGLAAIVHTPEVHLDSLCDPVSHLYKLM